MMPTAYSTVFTATASIKLAIVAQCATALAAAVIIVRAARSAIPWTELGLMAATATFLVLPYAFNYDMEVVGLGAAFLLFDAKRQLDLVGRVLALLALGAPVLVLVLSPHIVPILPLVLLGFLWVQARAYGVLGTPELKPALA
jgi:alpha-1,2-mannosyltransferase